MFMGKMGYDMVVANGLCIYITSFRFLLFPIVAIKGNFSLLIILTPALLVMLHLLGKQTQRGDF